METRIREEKNATVVSVRGRMDAAASPVFGKQLLELIGGGERYLVIDMEELEYISSAGLRVILGIEGYLKKKNGKIFLCALENLVKEVFEISGFTTMLPVCDTVESALSQIP